MKNLVEYLAPVSQAFDEHLAEEIRTHAGNNHQLKRLVASNMVLRRFVGELTKQEVLTCLALTKRITKDDHLVLTLGNAPY